jgi:hypothetical protein
MLLVWELREELNNVQQGVLLVMAQVCLGFFLLVNESKMDA